MIQGSEQWLEWRRARIGASDQAHLQCCAPWSQGWGYLYDIKKGLAQEQGQAWYMERGLEDESAARLDYSMQTELDVEPTLVENKEFPYLCASLDGWNKEGMHGIEIKRPSKEDHKLALNGEIPHKYIPQLCHQVFVTGAKSWDYVSFDGEKCAIVPFKPSKQLVLEIMEAAHRFWNEFYLKNIRPEQSYPHPLFDIRIPEIKDEELIKEAATNLQLKSERDRLDGLIEESDRRLLDGCTLSRAKIGGIQIVSQQRKGVIDYSKVPQLANVDVELYRKEGKFIRSIRRVGSDKNRNDN